MSLDHSTFRGNVRIYFLWDRFCLVANLISLMWPLLFLSLILISHERNQSQKHLAFQDLLVIKSEKSYNKSFLA